ncbi:MAG: 30S ribosomal protein S4 [bacterium]|nr:30S ribosomal protein S4 [bacterium]
MQKGVVRKRRPTPLSEYGRQLQEKQDLKLQYNLREKQLKNYVKGALSKAGQGDSTQLLLESLERRLDNVVFRAGFAPTRKQARQMVTHGHFLVNTRKVDVPSFQVKKGDAVAVRPSSKERPLFKSVVLGLKKYEAPAWLSLNKEAMEVSVQQFPTFKEAAPSVEIPLIFEFYSR